MSLTDEDSWQLATNLDRLLLDATWRRQAEPIDRSPAPLASGHV